MIRWMLRFDVNRYLSPACLSASHDLTHVDSEVYALREETHNGAACWVQVGVMDEAWSERFWKRRLKEIDRVDKSWQRVWLEFDLSIEHSRFGNECHWFYHVSGLSKVERSPTESTTQEARRIVPFHAVPFTVKFTGRFAHLDWRTQTKIVGSDEVWHIFRAADGLSWVIDSEANPVQTVRWC